MQFQDDDIKKLASLSRLELSKHDIEMFRDQLSSVLAYIDQVATIQIHDDDAAPLDDPVFREDIQMPSDATCDELLEAAPHTEEGHILSLQVK